MTEPNEYTVVFKKNPSHDCLTKDDCGRGELDKQIKFLEGEVLYLRRQRNIVAVTLFIVMALITFFHKHL